MSKTFSFKQDENEQNVLKKTIVITQTYEHSDHATLEDLKEQIVHINREIEFLKNRKIDLKNQIAEIKAALAIKTDEKFNTTIE